MTQCTATSKQSQRQCGREAVPGAAVCTTHGGSAPQVRAAALQRRLEANVRGELESMGWAPMTDPVGAMQDLAGEIIAFKDLARSKVNELESWELTLGSMGEDGDGFRAFAEQARAAITTYERAVERSMKILSTMLGLNLEARRVRVAEADARRVLSALFGALDAPGVGLSESQRAAVSQAFVKGLSETKEQGL